MTGFKNILHATDFSDASERACDRSVQLARECGAQLTLLHAYADPTTVAEAWSVMDPRADLEKALEQVACDVSDVPICRVLYVGPPAESIVEYAREHNMDLIVIGTHGRTGFLHLLTGSVAEKVIRMAPCPVMVVRPQKTEAVEPQAEEKHDSSRHVIVI